MFAGINMYTYLKFGLPRVMPMGLDEVHLNTNFVLWTMTFLAFCFAGCYSVTETIRLAELLSSNISFSLQ